MFIVQIFFLYLYIIKSLIIMKNTDFTIDEEDLKILFSLTRQAYPNYTFAMWENEVKDVYENAYLKNTDFPLTFSKWINCQIISLTTLL